MFAKACWKNFEIYIFPRLLSFLKLKNDRCQPSEIMITESELLTFDIKTIVELFFYYMISKNFMRTKSSKQNQPNEILLLSNKQLKEVPNNLSSNFECLMGMLLDSTNI